MRALSEVNILVADDHEIVRQGVRNLLEPQPGWNVVAEVSNGTQAVEKTTELKPQVALLDVSMPEMNGLEATRRIREALPQTEVVILSVHDSEQTMREALACGARGYVVKSDAGRNLVAAVESASRHQVFVSPSLSQPDGYPTYTSREGPLAELTGRETEILQLLSEGYSNKDIAIRLDISVKTAETHRTNMMRKIGAHSLADLVRYALRNGLVQP